MSKPLDVFEAPLQGISVVEASAGTGKTYNITSLYVRAILEKSLVPADILVLTYTEAATAELKFRLRERLRNALKAFEEGETGGDTFLNELVSREFINPEIKLRNAINHFDEAAVFTIHGFCNRLLKENSLQFNVPADFDVIKDESELVQECVDSYWREFIRSAKDDFFKQTIYEFLVDENFGPEELQSIIYEIITRPYVQLEPLDFNMNKLEGLLGDFRNKFSEIKYYWKEEREKLEEILWNEGLSGNRYPQKSRSSYWAGLLEWIGQDTPSINHFEKLVNFGLKISRSGNKGVEFDELTISKAIDQFIHLAEQLRQVKPAFIREAVNEVEAMLAKRKSDLNLLSYHDFLSKVNQALEEDPSGVMARRLSEKYPVALVDEFQDTDPIQYSIFSRIYRNREQSALFMIGDPKQAIYGFRGADIYTYFKAKEDAKTSQIYTLSSNYRSTPAMIEGVNEVFSKAEAPFLIEKEKLEFNPARFPEHKERDIFFYDDEGKSGKPVKFIKLEGKEGWNKPDYTRAVIDSTVSEIVDLLNGEASLNGKTLEERDIAILVRKTRQGEELQSRLRAAGIKSVLKAKSSVFKTKESDELFLILKAVLHLSYEPGIRAALATDLLGKDASEIQALLEDEQTWNDLYYQFVVFKREWEQNGIEAVTGAIFSAFKTKELLAGEPDAERRITNLIHLSDLLSKAEEEQKLYGKNLLKWFYRKKQGNYQEAEEEELRLESDEKLIQISTIHASKGLEYPVVFCPFLWDDVSPKTKRDVLYFNKKEQVYLDFSVGVDNEERKRHIYLDLKESMAESVRLAYVALTRAEYACFIHLPDYDKVAFSPLAAALEGGENTDRRLREKVLENKKKDDFDYRMLLQSLEQGSQLEVIAAETEISRLQRNSEIEEQLSTEALTFTRNDLNQFPRMLSYSGLSRMQAVQEDVHDYDEWYGYVPQSEKEKRVAMERSPFTFPKGAKAGTFLHHLFENINFVQPDNLDELTVQELASHGFDPLWKEVVTGWVSTALQHPLQKNSVRLSDLDEEDVLKEMEFYFPVEDLRIEKLWSIIRENEMSDSEEDRISGFMKGFIDLTFRYQGKYYILDYKSNYLGDSYRDYSPETLKEEMKIASYDLQYHIYTVALHRFLKEHLSTYRYEGHFGGVFYLFLRGIEAGKPESGVFFDKPSAGIIEQFDHVFGGGSR